MSRTSNLYFELINSGEITLADVKAELARRPILLDQDTCDLVIPWVWEKEDELARWDAEFAARKAAVEAEEIRQAEDARRWAIIEAARAASAAFEGEEPF